MEILPNFIKPLIYDAQNPMIFNSGVFLILFIVFISVYALIHKNRISVTLFVIAFSFFFYYKSSGIYLLILAFTSVTDYSFALAITQAHQKSWRKFWFILSVGSSLGILAFFKYTNFFIENIINFARLFGNFAWFENALRSMDIPIFMSFAEIVSRNFQPLDIFLPIGISFYTFQSISYVVDVYQKKLPPTRNFLDYVFFLSFFPQLVAGPIVKANLFLPQLKKKINIGKAAVWGGAWLIMIGLIKKAVIADYIAQYNDLVFADPLHYSGFENLMAILGYALQIYGDFSGYSDMAIGLGLLMGFDLGKNFNFPYKSMNITDFWRRWHISLSSWLRDYLYIQMGGNRKGKWKMYRNLFLTMFLGGLWHGASWKFVVWGSAHGFALAIHKATKNWLDKIPNNIFSNSISWALTFIFVITLWIFFRANDIPETYTTVKITDGADVEYYSKTINQTDSTKQVAIYLTLYGQPTDTIVAQVPYLNGQKISLKDKNIAGDKEITVRSMLDAYQVSVIMIKKVLFEMDIAKYAPEFLYQKTLWLVLFIIGFIMHFTPTYITNRISESYINWPYFVKVIVFLIVVQLVVQLKSEEVVPFIYFQF